MTEIPRTGYQLIDQGHGQMMCKYSTNPPLLECSHINRALPLSSVDRICQVGDQDVFAEFLEAAFHNWRKDRCCVAASLSKADGSADGRVL
ncbi:hypothetical protein J6590_011503 [Homalodisca vitripennis]|nr:hypothetical protein J6590_011503 [Homalodisca vitripennis]